jgi:hypothetical protein
MPLCERVHGRRWNAFGILLASAILNALSFFLTMRWKQALSFLLGFVLLHTCLGIMLNRYQLSGTLELLLMGTAFLGPLVRHEVALDSATATKHNVDGNLAAMSPKRDSQQLLPSA